MRHPSRALRVASSLALASLLGATTVAADEIAVKEGVVYATHADHELALNYALPAGDGPFPGIICIHGGGWRGGHRDVYNGLIRRFAAQGYAAFTVSYRLTQVAAWPAQLEDVKAAHAWIVAHADELRLDASRLGAVGDSAGGHLSLMLGLLADASKGERPLVQAVVNFYGPTDMVRAGVFESGVEPLITNLAGGSREEKGEAVYRSLSPVTYVTAGDAPVLTFHGDADRVVPVGQARVLDEALSKAGVAHHLEVLEGKGHGWGGEDREATVKQGLEFFDAYLRGGGEPLLVHEDFDELHTTWKQTDPKVWKHVRGDGGSYYSMLTHESAYQPKVRSPFNIALLEDAVVEDFDFDVSMQYTHRDYGHASLCLFFGYQDPEHFYYVHFGKQADAHANSIFIVNGAPRVSIATERTDGTSWDRAWHRARIRRDVSSGRIEVFFDDMQKPIMRAADTSFTWGKVGIGSFDDKGNFDTIRLYGKKKSD